MEGPCPRPRTSAPPGRRDCRRSAPVAGGGGHLLHRPRGPAQATAAVRQPRGTDLLPAAGPGRRRRPKMGYVLRGGEEGAERLRLLGRVVGPTTEALLSRVGVADGMSCLDVGCGLGAVTRELARRAGPAGQVVGLDIDEGILDLARRDAAQQALGIVFRAGGVLELADGPA